MLQINLKLNNTSQINPFTNHNSPYFVSFNLYGFTLIMIYTSPSNSFSPFFFYHPNTTTNVIYYVPKWN